MERIDAPTRGHDVFVPLIPGTILAVVLLLGVLGFAVARPWNLPESVAAVPAAGLVVALGIVEPGHAWSEIITLLPVVAFLAAVLVLSHLCQAEGLFDAAGTLMAHRAAGNPQRLLVLVFGVASVVTAVLSLDATVVLLTPVVLATATRSGVRPRPYVYATTHLANSASVLMPISNLTNLLALTASGLTFARFTALMALPWVSIVAIEYIVFRKFFAAELCRESGDRPQVSPPDTPPVSRVSVVILGGTLSGFVLASLMGVPPAWAAAVGALIMGVRVLTRNKSTTMSLLAAANLPFCLFVLALGVLVLGVTESGLGPHLARIIPSGTSFPALLGIAALAAVASNLLNNLPAVLLLIPLAMVAGGPVACLAVLIGVNVGPNLTYVGSLATLLWRRILREHDTGVSVGEFSRLGAVSVPATLLVGTCALWVSSVVLGE